MDSSPENSPKKNQRNKAKKAFRKKRRRPSRYRKQNAIIQELASERIDYLMKSAKQIYSKNPDLANRYIVLARKYSMSAKTPIPIQHKKFICHKCKKLLIPGVSSRHRIQSRKKKGSRYVVTCLQCNHVSHFYFKQKAPPQK